MIDQLLDHLKGQRLLIVEDEYTLASDLAQWLREAGAEVVGPAGSVTKALTLVSSNSDNLDGAILDVNLRGEQVFPVADALLAAGVPFIFATGYDSHVLPQAYAAMPRCEKPVDTMQLARLLQRIGRT
jgi:DNA-binding NtrC family response regulator